MTLPADEQPPFAPRLEPIEREYRPLQTRLNPFTLELDEPAQQQPATLESSKSQQQQPT